MLGAGQAATPKNAKQKTKEMQAQQISMIIMGKNTAIGVPCAICHARTHPNNSPRLGLTLHYQDFSYAPGTAQVWVLQYVATYALGRPQDNPNALTFPSLFRRSFT